MGRLLPRFSLLTAILLMTIVGLAIGVIQFWRKVGPSRIELRRLRAQTGQLTVDDPNTAQGVCIRKDRDSWRWRLYLPPKGQNAYYLKCASGHFPNGMHDKAWYSAIQRGGNRSVSSPIRLDGEFTLQCSLSKEGNDWIIDTEYERITNGIGIPGGLTTSVFEPSGDWLGIKDRFDSSSFDEDVQREFRPNEPILLLHIMRSEVEITPNGTQSVHAPTGEADGVALWIESTFNASNQ